MTMVFNKNDKRRETRSKEATEIEFDCQNGRKVDKVSLLVAEDSGDVEAATQFFSD